MWDWTTYPSAMTWVVYILECSDGSLYTGSTTDLKRRLCEHQEGKGARYTKGRRPVKLVFKQPAHNRSEAQYLESVIKRMTRKEKLQMIKWRGSHRWLRWLYHG